MAPSGPSDKKLMLPAGGNLTLTNLFEINNSIYTAPLVTLRPKSFILIIFYGCVSWESSIWQEKRPKIQDINHIIEDYGTVCLKNMEPKKTKYDQNFCSRFQ